jgi:hypothetical protein
MSHNLHQPTVMKSLKKRHWKLVGLMALLILSLGALPPALGADTIDVVYITNPTTWDGSQSLTTDVVIVSGGSLTILGTCTVQAGGGGDPDPYTGGLSDRVEIIVADGGVLTVESGATLTAPNPAEWYGIVFLSGSSGSVSGATISNGIVGITAWGASPTIQNNTIRNMQGVSGVLYGESGGLAAGIVVSGTSTAQVSGNTIQLILGGHGSAGAPGNDGLPGGDPGASGQAGGDGAAAYGIRVMGGAAPLVSGNTISDITGGSGASGGSGGNGTPGWAFNPPGGAGGAGGNGGRGGAAAGISVEGTGTSGLIQSNDIRYVVGGSGAMGGDGGMAGVGWECGTQHVPHAAGPGGDGGAGGHGGHGGDGGSAIGIYVLNATPTLEDNAIAGTVIGGQAEAGGSANSGSSGGRACNGGPGEDGGTGGTGGAGGAGGAGGYGGNAFGIAVQGVSGVDIRHNTISAQLTGGTGAGGRAGGNGGIGGLGGNGGDDMSNQSGHGGNGGSGGQGGGGGAAGAAGGAVGIATLGGTATVARNSVISLLVSTSAGAGGDGGDGGSAGNGGWGGTGPFPGNGGHGGVGGAGGMGGLGADGGSATGLMDLGDHRIENNLLHSFSGGSGTDAGAGGDGGPGGDGGSAGSANALAGNGGDGGDGGDSPDGGNSGQAMGLALNGNTEVVNNTINNIGINIHPGSGGNGGQGGQGGSAGAVGQPGTPGSTGNPGAVGLTGNEGGAYGLYIAAGLPAIVNNIVTITGVGKTRNSLGAHGGAATSYGIFSGVGPLTLELDYNDVWGWDTGSYYDLTPGAHDISLDPAFADVNTGNYHLQGGSLCRNAGTSAFGGLTLPTEDLDGNTRPQGVSHDMGAYEYPEAACVPVTGVTIGGPTSGLVGVPYGFNTTVAPANATEPIAYTWTPAPASGQGTVNASYTWSAAGTYNISVAVSNCSGQGTGTDDHGITISAGTVLRVFLPIVEIHR